MIKKQKKKQLNWDEPKHTPTSEEWIKMIKDWVEKNKPSWMKYTINILENQEKIMAMNYKDKFWIDVLFYTKINKKNVSCSAIITQSDITMTIHPYNLYGDLVCYKINEAMQHLIKEKEGD